MRAIIANLPAPITHVDVEHTYTFSNAYVGKAFGINPAIDDLIPTDPQPPVA